MREAILKARLQGAGESAGGTLEHIASFCPDEQLDIPARNGRFGMHPAFVLNDTAGSVVVDAMKGTDCRHEIWLGMHRQPRDRMLLVRTGEAGPVSGFTKDTLFHTSLPVYRSCFCIRHRIIDNLGNTPGLRERIARLKKVLCHGC